MTYVWICFILFLSMALEFSLALLGFSVPLTYMGGFYFTLLFGWRRSALPFMAFSVLLELSFGRSLPFLLLFSLPVMFGAFIWRRYGNLKETTVQALPGFCIGLASVVASLGYTLVFSLNATGKIYPFSPMPMLMQMLSGTILFPVYCALLDGFAKDLGYRRYRLVHRFQVEETDYAGQ